MRSKRSVQINVCLTEREMRTLRKRAARESEGNVSALVRRALFPVAPVRVQDVDAWGAIVQVAEGGEVIPASSNTAVWEHGTGVLSEEQLREVARTGVIGAIYPVGVTVEEDAESNALRSHSEQCTQRIGGECNCGVFESNQLVYAENTQLDAEEVHCE